MAPAMTIDIKPNERDWKQAFMVENATFRIINIYKYYWIWLCYYFYSLLYKYYWIWLCYYFYSLLLFLYLHGFAENVVVPQVLRVYQAIHKVTNKQNKLKGRMILLCNECCTYTGIGKNIGTNSYRQVV